MQFTGEWQLRMGRKMHRKVESIVEGAHSMLPVTITCVEVKELIDQHTRDN
jgi:hypothetical protein